MERRGRWGAPPQRDQKTRLILVLSVVGAGIGVVLLQSWFLGPLGEYNRQIDALEGEVDTKDQQYSQIIRDMPLAPKGRAQHNLPANPVKANVDYDDYLIRLCRVSGLTNVDVNPPGRPADAKAGPAVPVAPNAAKKPGHIVLKYTVHAKGKPGQHRFPLENLQRTPVISSRHPI